MQLGMSAKGQKQTSVSGFVPRVPHFCRYHSKTVLLCGPPKADIRGGRQDRGESYSTSVNPCSYEYPRVVVKGPMRKIALALVVAVLPTWAAAQQTNWPPKYPKKTLRPHSTIGNPCAQYGVGFARVAGSDICIKIGGSVGVEAGGSSRR